MRSTIIANNVLHGTNAVDATGSANLIMSSTQPIPADTIADDPQLSPLADNGGFTRTHAIYSGSPAVDHGSAGTFDYDQRGPGFSRVMGSSADIGASESDPSAIPDRIFRDGFD